MSSEELASTLPLIVQLEQISRDHPLRVLRLSGLLAELAEPFELLIYRGFSSSTTHPTAFDPDQPVLPHGLEGLQAELLQAPLDPAAELRIRGPLDPAAYLDPQLWS